MALVMSPNSYDGDCRIPVNAALTPPISDRAHHRASTSMVVGVDLEFNTVLLYLTKPSQCGVDGLARHAMLLL